MGKKEIITTTFSCDECGKEKTQAYQPSDWRVIGLQRFKTVSVLDILLCNTCLYNLQVALPNSVPGEE